MFDCQVYINIILIIYINAFICRSNSQSNAPSSGGSVENGPSTGLSSSRKSKSIDRIPRLPDRKDGTARARATWRVPNRRQSELLRSSHHHHHENKSPRTRSDGEVDVRDVTLLFQLRSHACLQLVKYF